MCGCRSCQWLCSTVGMRLMSYLIQPPLVALSVLWNLKALCTLRSESRRYFFDSITCHLQLLYVIFYKRNRSCCLNSEIPFLFEVMFSVGTWAHRYTFIKMKSYPLFRSCSFCISYVTCSGACLEVVWRFEWTFYIGSHAKRCSWWTKIGCFSFKSKYYLQACITSGKKITDLGCKPSKRKSNGTNEKSCWIQSKLLLCVRGIWC